MTDRSGILQSVPHPDAIGRRLAGGAHSWRAALWLALLVLLVGATAVLNAHFRAAPHVGNGSPAARDDDPGTPPPVGLQRHSLLRRANLVPALHRMERRAGGELRSLRIAPDVVDAQVLTPEGRLRTIEARFDGEVEMLSDVSAPDLRGTGTFRWAAVDPRAPRRILRAMTRAGTPRAFDYAVLSESPALRWSAYRTDGQGFTATARGSAVTQSGG